MTANLYMRTNDLISEDQCPSRAVHIVACHEEGQCRIAFVDVHFWECEGALVRSVDWHFVRGKYSGHRARDLSVKKLFQRIKACQHGLLEITATMGGGDLVWPAPSPWREVTLAEAEDLEVGQTGLFGELI